MSLLPPYTPLSTPVNLLSALALLLLHLPNPPPQIPPLLHYLSGYHLSLYPSLPLSSFFLSILLPSPSPLNSPPLLQTLALATVPLLLTKLLHPTSLTSPTPLIHVALLTSLLSLFFLLTSHPDQPTTFSTFIFPLSIPPANLRHAALLFNLRQNLTTFLRHMPLIPSSRLLYHSLNSSIFVLLGALTRTFRNHTSTFHFLRSAATLASVGWLFTELSLSPLQDGLPSGLSSFSVAAFIIVLHQLLEKLVPYITTILTPLAILGGNFLLALVVVELKVIERVLDGISFGAVSVLDIVKAACEVATVGNPRMAHALYAGFKILMLILLMMSWEGTLPLSVLNVGAAKYSYGRRRLGIFYMFR